LPTHKPNDGEGTANPPRHSYLIVPYKDGDQGAIGRTRMFTKKNLDSIIRSLLLVRLGQELGTDSTVSRAIADFLDVIIHHLK